MSTFCACMGPEPGHRHCPCMERQGFREPIHPIGDNVPPGYWDKLTRLLKDAPRLEQGSDGPVPFI